MPSTYATSRDYDLLLQLMPTHRLVCFVDYRVHGDYRPQPPCRDVCATRYEPGNPDSIHESMRQPYLAAQSRGVAYAGGLHMSPEKFKKDCAKVNLEFLLPQPPAA